MPITSVLGGLNDSHKSLFDKLAWVVQNGEWRTTEGDEVTGKRQGGGRVLNRVRRVYATKRAREHMAEKHQVTWDEVLEALEAKPAIYRTYPSESGERRYIAFGRTEAGRPLVIVLALEKPDTFRVIMAYETKGKKQLRRFRRRER